MKRKLEALQGKLGIAVNGGIVYSPFTYRITQNREFIETVGVGINIAYTGVKMGIYTSHTELPFSRNRPIILADGTTMTIENITEDINERMATFGGDGVQGLFITLNGGK